MKRIISLPTALFAVLLCLFTAPLFADSVPKMAKEVLQAKLGAQNLVILDGRQARDWENSELKIKDAMRVDNGDLSTVMNLPKDTTIVVYCA